MVSQESYLSICSHFNSASHFLRNNYDTTNNTSENHNTPSSLLASKALLTILSIYDPTFAPTAVAINVSTTFRAINGKHEIHPWKKPSRSRSSCYFLCISDILYVSFCQWRRCPRFPSFSDLFRRRHRVLLDTGFSPIRMKNSSIIRPGLFTGSHLIRLRELWKTTLEWLLWALLYTSVETATKLFTDWQCLPNILFIFNVDLIFASLDIIGDLWEPV